MTVIKEIKLSLGKKDVTLTLEQAKELKVALDDMFGKEVIIRHEDAWHYTPWPHRFYGSTTIYGNEPVTYGDSCEVTCSGDTLWMAI